MAGIERELIGFLGERKRQGESKSQKGLYYLPEVVRLCRNEGGEITYNEDFYRIRRVVMRRTDGRITDEKEPIDKSVHWKKYLSKDRPRITTVF